jgi:GxxExxY protein
MDENNITTGSTELSSQRFTEEAGELMKTLDTETVKGFFQRNMENNNSLEEVRPAYNSGYFHSELTSKIIECALEVHTELGPGLLEGSYEQCLYYELVKAGLKVQRQLGMPLIYKEVKMDIGYRVDLLVEDKVIVEIKTVEEFADVHSAQLLTYLKLSGCKVGLLLNFKVARLKQGIKRLVL